MRTEDPHTATQTPYLNGQPSANWRPGHRKFRERKSVDHTIRHGIRSMMRSVAQRDDFDTPDLRTLAELNDYLDVAITLAVANLRDQGVSWSAIGRELNCTKQAAHERFKARGVK